MGRDFRPQKSERKEHADAAKNPEVVEGSALRRARGGRRAGSCRARSVRAKGDGEGRRGFEEHLVRQAEQEVRIEIDDGARCGTGGGAGGGGGAGDDRRRILASEEADAGARPEREPIGERDEVTDARNDRKVGRRRQTHRCGCGSGSRFDCARRGAELDHTADRKVIDHKVVNRRRQPERSSLERSGYGSAGGDGIDRNSADAEAERTSEPDAVDRRSTETGELIDRESALGPRFGFERIGESGAGGENGDCCERKRECSFHGGRV